MSEQRLEHIDIDKLVASKTNPRMDFAEDKMKELIDSIREQGILQPILLRPLDGDRYEIACGERRYRAALALGLKQVPAAIREMDDKTVLEVQLIENMQRVDVHPLEEAEGYEQLMQDHGYESADQIADKVGRSKSYVYGRLKLCELTTECRRMFYEGILNPSTALLIARMPQGLQKDAAGDIKGVSYREACDIIQSKYMLNLKGVGFSKDDSICPELGACATCTKRTGNQNLLFPEIKSADVCTDTNCFHTKRAEYVQRQQAKAEKTGLDVLKTKSVFPHGDAVAPGFVELNEKCPRDPEGRTYKDLIKKSVNFKPSLAIDNTGKIREVVKRADAERVLVEGGLIPYASASLIGNEKKADLEKQKQDQKIRAEVCPGLITEIVRRVREDKEQSFWKVLAEAVLRLATGEQEVLMAQRIDKNVKREDARAFLESYTQQIESSDYPDFVAEMLCWPAFPGWNDYPETVVSFCQLYGIDLKETEEAVRSKYEQEKKQEAVAPVETPAANNEAKQAVSETKEPKKRRAKAKVEPKANPAPAPDNSEPTALLTNDGCSVKITMKDVKPEDQDAARAGLLKLGGKIFSKGK